MKKISVNIAGMHCRSCEILLEEEIGKVSHVKRVNVNHAKGTATITFGGSQLDVAAVREAVKTAGYEVVDNHEKFPFFSRDIEAYVNIVFAVGGAFILFLIANRFGWFSFSLSAANLDASSAGLIFLIGLTAGISTCATLVGGLVLGVSARFNTLHPELSVKQKFIPHIWFNAGRVIGFAVFGALLGALGNILQASIGFAALLTFFAGLVMLFLGLQLSQLFPRLRHLSFALPKGLSRLLGVQHKKDSEYSHRGAFTLGALTFFLPCGFTQAVQLAVVAFGSPVVGAMAMSLFALGTVPGLLALGGIGTAVRGGMRDIFFAFIAVVLVAFGGWNVTSGLQLFGIDTTVFQGEVKNDTGTKKPKEQGEIKNGVRIIRLTQDATGYRPNTFPPLEAGVPVRMIINSTNSYTCASSFVIPQFRIQKRLQPGENIIEFTPKKSGKIPFSCSMGMYRGVFTVSEKGSL